MGKVRPPLPRSLLDGGVGRACDRGLKTSIACLVVGLLAAIPAGLVRAGVPVSAGAQGAWEPVVLLRDDTGHFPGTPQRPKPAGGWWGTPIHASLQGDGRVLITGWGRFDRQDCRTHRTRQNGVRLR